ncbi:hypothetical protein T492DRAFT_882240, partial [Pavlovales sp. CCMP2436]
MLAALQFVDFYTTGAQRVAVSTAAALCASVTIQTAHLTAEAAPTLCRLTASVDGKAAPTLCRLTASVDGK